MLVVECCHAGNFWRYCVCMWQDSRAGICSVLQQIESICAAVARYDLHLIVDLQLGCFQNLYLRATTSTAGRKKQRRNWHPIPCCDFKKWHVLGKDFNVCDLQLSLSLNSWLLQWRDISRHDIYNIYTTMCEAHRVYICSTVLGIRMQEVGAMLCD